MKIDEKVYIPLHWFLAAMSSIIICTSVVAFWIKSVNDYMALGDKRFSRIENKLGIPALVESPSSMEAHAEER